MHLNAHTLIKTIFFEMDDFAPACDELEQLLNIVLVIFILYDLSLTYITPPSPTKTAVREKKHLST